MIGSRVNVDLLLVTLGVALTSCGADTWHYPKPNPDGTVGQPENWGGSCDTGHRQSPIDVNYKAAVKGAYPEFVFVNYDQPMRNASLVNNGHTIQVNVDDVSASVYGGGLRSKYILEQFHFHWSSEHTLDDQRYALEIHLVHRNSKYGTIAEASGEKAGIAVLAVLFHVDEQPSEVIETILDVTAAVKDKLNDYVRLTGDVILNSFLPKDRSEYFRYEGSLTTPFCAESVVWTVFPESLPISLAQLEEFKTIQDVEQEALVLNYRPVQPLNARVLVWVADTERAVDSGTLRGSSIHALTAIGSLLLSVVICYFRL